MNTKKFHIFQHQKQFLPPCDAPCYQVTHHGPGPLARVSEALRQLGVIEHSGVPLAADHALVEVLGGDNVAPVTQTLHSGEL